MSTYVPYIPITKTILTKYSSHLYIFCQVARKQMHHIEYDFAASPPVLFFILNDNVAASRKSCGFTRDGFDRAAKQIIEEDHTYTNEFICLMPSEVWDRFDAFLSTKPTRSRNGWTKVYLYLYWQIVSHPEGFFHSIKQFSAFTGVNQNRVCEYLIELEQGGFIIRGSFNSEVGLARTYRLPPEDLPFADFGGMPF